MGLMKEKLISQLGERRNLVLSALVFALVLLLGWWGVLTIASSQRMLPAAYRLAGRQMLYLAGAAVVMPAAAAVPFRVYCRYSWQAALLALAALGSLTVFGIRVNGMRGWFDLGWCYLQPSEVLKGVFVLNLSIILCSDARPEKRFPFFLVYLLVWLLAVGAQPDFGTMSVYAGSAMILYCAADGKLRDVAFALGIFAVLGGALANLHPYMASRVYDFFTRDGNYYDTLWHLKQFELAAAGGGWTGTKLGGTMWSSSYLPLAYNDSALATMAETLGFLGVMFYFALFAVLIFLLCKLGESTRSSAAKLFVFGAASMLGWQSFLHIAVNAALVPTTGLTLPFISYGGSSLIGSALLTGMALSAARSGEESAPDAPGKKFRRKEKRPPSPAAT